MSIHIENLFIKQDNVNGDNNLWLGADGPAQKIDGRLFVAALAVIAIALIGSTLYGMMVGALAFGAMIAPYVVGGALAVGGGIGGVTVWQRRLLKQAATVQPALPLPTFSYKELPAPMREFAANYYAHTGKHLTPGQLETLEMQLVAAQLSKQCAPLQPSLPSASSQSPISYSA